MTDAAEQKRLDAVAHRAEKRLAAWRDQDPPAATRHATADELEAAIRLARGADAEDKQ